MTHDPTPASPARAPLHTPYGRAPYPDTHYQHDAARIVLRGSGSAVRCEGSTGTSTAGRPVSIGIDGSGPIRVRLGEAHPDPDLARGAISSPPPNTPPPPLLNPADRVLQNAIAHSRYTRAELRTLTV
jgi:hypothetical protein